MLNEFWKSAKLKGTLSIRMYRGLFSIAQAQAKLHLKKVVDEEIAKLLGSSPDAIMYFKEGMKALESGDSNGAIMHLKVADQYLG